MALSDRDRALLDFEARWNAHGAAKEQAIGRDLALAPARYYQLLERVIDDPDAAAYNALLVHRLRRLRERAEGVRAGDRAPVATVRTGAAR